MLRTTVYTSNPKADAGLIDVRAVADPLQTPSLVSTMSKSFLVMFLALAAFAMSTGKAVAGGSTAFTMPIQSCVPRFAADAASIRRLPQGLTNVSRTKSVQILCPLQEPAFIDFAVSDVCETDFFNHKLFAVVSLRTALSGTTQPSLTLLKVAAEFPTGGSPPLATSTRIGTVLPVNATAFSRSLMSVRIECQDVDRESAPTAIVKLPPFATLVYMDYEQE